MSPIVGIVFGPVVALGVVLVGLLLGAACAGVWEAVEARSQGRPSATRPSRQRVAPPEGTPSRAT